MIKAAMTRTSSPELHITGVATEDSVGMLWTWKWGPTHHTHATLHREIIRFEFRILKLSLWSCVVSEWSCLTWQAFGKLLTLTVHERGSSINTTSPGLGLSNHLDHFLHIRVTALMSHLYWDRNTWIYLLLSDAVTTSISVVLDANGVRHAWKLWRECDSRFISGLRHFVFLYTICRTVVWGSSYWKGLPFVGGHGNSLGCI